MSKILFLSLTELKKAPYYKKYLKKTSKRPDLLYLGESIEKENSLFDEIFYISKKNNKLFQIINYRARLKKIIQSEKYSLIVILHSQISVMCNDILLKSNIPIILDIRDYIMEDVKVYSYLQNKIIRNSKMVVLSSPGFINFLPQNMKYYICHNTYENDVDISLNFNKEKLTKEKIIIGQIGYVRFRKINEKFIQLFANDNRFHIKFLGKGADEINISNFDNVEVKGEFDSNETIKLYHGLNFVNNYYGNEKKSLLYALSNKLYISALLNIPIIVTKNTYMHKYIEKYGLGLSIDIEDDNENQKEKIVEYYKNLDYEIFQKSCEIFLNEVESENREFEDCLERLVKKYENSTY